MPQKQWYDRHYDYDCQREKGPKGRFGGDAYQIQHGLNLILIAITQKSSVLLVLFTTQPPSAFSVLFWASVNPVAPVMFMPRMSIGSAFLAFACVDIP